MQKDLTKIDLKKPPRESGEIMAAFMSDLRDTNHNTSDIKKIAESAKIPNCFVNLFVGGVK